MFLISGTRTIRIDARMIHGNVQCAHCDQMNSYGAVTQSSYIHIFWIPILAVKKETTLVCTHCKKNLSPVEAPEKLRHALNRSLQEQPAKHKWWEYFGCLGIAAVFVLFFSMSVFAIFYNVINGDPNSQSEPDYEQTYSTSPEIKEEKPPIPLWQRKLNKDKRNCIFFPDASEHPLEFSLFHCIERDLPKADRGDISYFTKIENHKILILIEALNIDKYSKKQKDSLFNKVNRCVDDVLEYKSYQKYVGVFKGNEFFLQQTPTESLKNSPTSNPQLLKEYYDNYIN